MLELKRAHRLELLLDLSGVRGFVPEQRAIVKPLWRTCKKEITSETIGPGGRVETHRRC